MKYVSRHTRQAGFSLVEIMIGTVLSMMIVGATLGLLLSTKVAYNDTDRIGELTESSRYGLHVLSEQLRLTDYWGGPAATDVHKSITLASITTDCSGAAAGHSLTNPLWATTATATTVADCITDAKIGSDVLFTKHVAAATTPLTSLDSARSYVVANNVTALLFDGSASPLPNTGVGGDVPSGIAWEYEAAAYYIADNNGVPTLYRKRLVGNAWQPNEEVASGVELLHLEFGEDTTHDGTADQFVAPSSATMSRVVSARIFLLVRTQSPDNTYTDGKSYTLGTLSLTPNDHYHRMVVQTTVTLRNRFLHIAGDPAAGGS